MASYGTVGGGVGREAPLHGVTTEQDQYDLRDDLTSRVLTAVQESPVRADYFRLYHRPRKKESSSSWAMVRSVGRKISGLWPFWSSDDVMEEDEEAVIARRRLGGKSGRRLRVPPPPMQHGGRRRYSGLTTGPRLDRGPLVGALWSVSVEPGDDLDEDDDYMVSLLMSVYQCHDILRQLGFLISVLSSRRLLLHAIRPFAAVEDAEPTPHAVAPGLNESGGRGHGKAKEADEEAPKVEEKTRSVVTGILLLKCS